MEPMKNASATIVDDVAAALRVFNRIFEVGRAALGRPGDGPPEEAANNECYAA
jgi:hypothetical protein